MVSCLDRVGYTGHALDDSHAFNKYLGEISLEYITIIINILFLNAHSLR